MDKISNYLRLFLDNIISRAIFSVVFIALFLVSIFSPKQVSAQDISHMTRIASGSPGQLSAGKVNNNGDVLFLTNLPSNSQTLNFFNRDLGTISSIYTVTYQQNNEYHIIGEYNFNDLGDIVWEVKDSLPYTYNGNPTYITHYSAYYKAFDSETSTFLGKSVTGNISGSMTAFPIKPRINNNRLIVTKGLIRGIQQGEEDLAITQIPETLLTPITINLSNIHAKIQFVEINDNNFIAYNYATNAPLWTYGDGKVILYNPISRSYSSMYAFISTNPPYVGDLTNNNTYFYTNPYTGTMKVACTTMCLREVTIAPNTTWIDANDNDHVIWYSPLGVVKYYDGSSTRVISIPSQPAEKARLGGTNEVIWVERQNNIYSLIWYDTTNNERHTLYETDSETVITNLDMSQSGYIVFELRNSIQSELILIEKPVFNSNPNSNAGQDQTVYEGQEVTFDGSASTDPDGFNDLVNFAWDFGDGTTGDGLSVSHTYTDEGIYSVVLTVTDSHGVSSSDNLYITVIGNVAPSANFSITPIQVFEGDTVILSFTDPFDPNPADVAGGFRYSYDCNDDGIYEASDITDMTYACLYLDNGTYTLRGQIKDQKDGATDYTISFQVNNMPPSIIDVAATIEPTQVQNPVNATLNISDPGIDDVITIIWNWGDGTINEEVVSNQLFNKTISGLLLSESTNNFQSVTATHVYTVPGVYTLNITVTDKDGDTDQESFQYFVVYDPDGGFVTGGGWINSPVGAYVKEPTLIGKANFGFVSKYQKGAKIPTGNTEFNFKVANLNFRSTSYDWLVVAGAKAQYKGFGMINGDDQYGFLLTVVDGNINGGGEIDKLRIKIWDLVSEDIVYDNQAGGSDDSQPNTSLEGGSVVIH